MSITTLPPIWQPWTKEHYQSLSLEDIEHLHAQLTRKVYELENQYLEETVFYHQQRRNKEEKEKEEDDKRNEFLRKWVSTRLSTK